MKSTLNDYMTDLELKMDRVIQLQEKGYYDTVLGFIRVKEKELNELLQRLREKNNSLSSQDKEIIDLKKMIVVIRQELLQADDRRIKVSN